MLPSHRSYLAAILLLASSPAAFAQETKPEQRPPGPGPRGMPASPKKGPTALPILPALPPLDDASFYARTDVPHGQVEQATYKNFAGKEKRMHVYLPPDYEADTGARYPVLYLNHGGGDDDSLWTRTDPRRAAARTTSWTT